VPTELVTTWFGAFLVEHGAVVREVRAPTDPPAVVERLRLRREGRLTPEEESLLADRDPSTLVTRDRRLETRGVPLLRARSARAPLLEPPAALLRTVLLEEAEVALAQAWDPSVHLEEAVRAREEIDRTRNLLGERLASWTARDRADVPEDEEAGGERAAEAILEPGSAPPSSEASPEADPELLALREGLARSYRALGELRRGLDAGIESAARRRLPNLSSVVGPNLAARLVAQAGGLDRLARLPASTIQVLGAETAFFDHLRRGTRPPRHGLLFLHPSIQGATRQQRGRLARALAGKAAIAARIDRAGGPIDPSLAAAFDRRSAEITRARTGRGRRSALPLDRAAEDR
jgi:nucleolar protein 56